MRLTTKIIGGIILSVFIISLTFIISLSFTDRKNFSRLNFNVIELPQDNKIGIELPPFKTIVIEEVIYDKPALNYSVSGNCNIYFEPTTEAHNTDMLFVPEALKDFVSIHSSDNVLTIKLDISASIVKYKNNESSYNAVSGVNLFFNISRIDIINKTNVLPVTINNIETDSMTIHSKGDINIVDCKALLIDPHLDVSYRKLSIKNSDVKRVNLDLDNIRNWNIENCNIEEQYITGSKKFYITQHKNEAGTINWIPKEKDAELNIKIQGEPAKITIQ